MKESVPRTSDPSKLCCHAEIIHQELRNTGSFFSWQDIDALTHAEATF